MAPHGIEVGVTFGPVDQWSVVSAGARQAESLGLDAVGFWDHYHSERPDWALISDVSACGQLVVITGRVRLVLMVLSAPNPPSEQGGGLLGRSSP